jgi:hypothetical protein
VLQAGVLELTQPLAAGMGEASMRMPVQERTADFLSRHGGRQEVTRMMDLKPSGDPSVRQRPVYVARTSATPLVDWLCLAEKASQCIPECGLDAECAPDGVDCF